MTGLEGFQRKYLRGLAHHLKPAVMIGQKGFTEALVKSVDEALERHELIKIKFVDFKEADLKKDLLEHMAEAVGCETVGVIGHTAILFRARRDPEKRKIILPDRE